MDEIIILEVANEWSGKRIILAIQASGKWSLILCQIADRISESFDLVIDMLDICLSKSE